MFDYSAFIGELRALVERGNEFSAGERHRDSESFRRWRHETEDLIHRINRLRYDINCGIGSRAFQVMSYGSVSEREQQMAFDKDFDDTLSELGLVIARFDKYGDPKDISSRPASAVVAAAEATKKARCPQCEREQNCDVRGKFGRTWQSDDEEHSVDGHNDYFILQCRGCEFVFFQMSGWFSEDWDVRRNPVTGAQEMFNPVTTTTLSTLPEPPSPAHRRAMEEMVSPLRAVDEQLGRIMDEVYVAHEKQSLILASVGLRTAFDRATEILQIDAGHSLEDKVKKLQEEGYVGETEARILSVVVDAGNAAAHRGWAPTSAEFQDLLTALEEFLRGAILKKGSAALRVAARIPPRPARPKKA
ncbi:DUF4145 domain-containing protein [Burkholderia ubonensis]|nr:DUF4145 domain-containing protein [Burkholderia ubonensis]